MSPSIQTARSTSGLSPVEDTALLRTAMSALRADTEALFAGVDDDLFRELLHPAYSPVGWHLAHIGYTEAYWLLVTAGGEPLPRPGLERLFQADGMSKAARVAVPPQAGVAGYLADIRERVFARLDAGPPPEEVPLWCFILQHEAQHLETVTFLLQMARGCPPASDQRPPGCDPAETVMVPAGEAIIGTDHFDAADNERDRHRVPVAAFRLGRWPVTQGRYAAFIDAGGYRRAEFWTAAGREWLAASDACRPLWWRDGADDHPVCGVSHHEALAYSRFAGGRLPTEVEWEYAARGAGGATWPWGEASAGSDRAHYGSEGGGTRAIGGGPAGRAACGADDLIGNVWEWTASPFAPWPGFRPWPYDGYSRGWFDGRHMALRGGSWATRSCLLGTTVRNWYLPEIREILAGFRLAFDGLDG